MDLKSCTHLEALEGRQLLTAWGAQERLIGQDLVASQFPHLTGAGEAVVVIDSGVDYNHPSLGGGWGKRVVAGWDFASNDSDPMSSSYAHGTGVAGMLAASPFDYGGQHFQGIVPGAKIIALRQANSSQLAAAFQWVVNNKAKYNIVAVNFTDFGGGNKTTAASIRASLAKLDSMNVYAAMPSGNNGATGGVGSYSTEADVGSTNTGGGMSGFTNRGPGLDYLAPGEKVTLPYYDVGSRRHIYVNVADGTSFSAPQITGAAAVLRQINPHFSNSDINSILSASAAQVYDSRSRRSYARLNLYNAVKLAYQRIGKVTPPPSNPTPPPGQPSGVSTSTPTPIGANTVLQAEDFDSGNEGTAYHDADRANVGGNNYRPGTGVDVISMNDQGSSRAIGFVKAGEWTRYAINVQSAGTYTIEFRVAAMRSGGQFHFEIDGKNVSGAMNVPDTRNWNSYASISKSGVSLSAGQHSMRLVYDRNGGTGFVGNFNLIHFVKNGSTPAPAAPAPASPTSAYRTFNLAAGSATTIQAEDFDNGPSGIAYRDGSGANEGRQYRNTGVDIENSRDSGGGYNVGYMTGGEWLDYTVNVTRAGTFNADFRIASAYSGGAFHLEVDGRNVTGTLHFANTHNFQAWTTLRKSGIALSAGKHTLRLVVDTTGGQRFAGNVNWIKFS